jgi:hypothetical protein
MSPMSMFEILDLPESSLRRLLPKASTRVVIQLVSAYPRTVGKIFLGLLENSVSVQTMGFIREQMIRNQTPTIGEIRQAELELNRLISSEHLLPAVHN